MADDANTPTSPSSFSDSATGSKDAPADAVAADKAYAQNAVNETGKKLVSLEERAAQWHASCSKRIAADPVKSVLLAAAGGALLAGLLLAFDRSDRRDCWWMP